MGHLSSRWNSDHMQIHDYSLATKLFALSSTFFMTSFLFLFNLFLIFCKLSLSDTFLRLRVCWLNCMPCSLLFKNNFSLVFLYWSTKMFSIHYSACNVSIDLVWSALFMMVRYTIKTGITSLTILLRKVSFNSDLKSHFKRSKKLFLTVNSWNEFNELLAGCD